MSISVPAPDRADNAATGETVLSEQVDSEAWQQKEERPR